MSRQHFRYGFILVVQNLGLSNPFSGVILSYSEISFESNLPRF